MDGGQVISEHHLKDLFQRMCARAFQVGENGTAGGGTNSAARYSLADDGRCPASLPFILAEFHHLLWPFLVARSVFAFADMRA